MDYLLARTGRDDLAGAARLAARLGGVPLAAEQAAVFLSMRKGISFDDYAAEIARLIKQPRPPGMTGEYRDTVYAALIKSLETVGQTDGGDIALDILRLCAFLSPDVSGCVDPRMDGGRLAVEKTEAVGGLWFFWSVFGFRASDRLALCLCNWRRLV